MASEKAVGAIGLTGVWQKDGMYMDIFGFNAGYWVAKRKRDDGGGNRMRGRL